MTGIVIALMFEHHPHRSGAHFRREVAHRPARHCSILSRVGASGKPGAVHYRRETRNPDRTAEFVDNTTENSCGGDEAPIAVKIGHFGSRQMRKRRRTDPAPFSEMIVT